MGEIISQESLFNEAILKMQRLHSSQERVNELRTNMLAWNFEFNKYNYEIIISDLISLCHEVAPLMKQKELEQFIAFRKLFDDMLELAPIHKTKYRPTFATGSPSKEIDFNNWEKLRNVMFLFEDFARKQIDVHGLASPKKKDAGKAVIDF